MLLAGIALLFSLRLRPIRFLGSLLLVLGLLLSLFLLFLLLLLGGSVLFV